MLQRVVDRFIREVSTVSLWSPSPWPITVTPAIAGRVPPSSSAEAASFASGAFVSGGGKSTRACRGSTRSARSPDLSVGHDDAVQVEVDQEAIEGLDQVRRFGL